MKLLQALVTSTLLVTPLAAHATPLSNQPSIIAALNAGQRVSAIVDLSQCTPQDASPRIQVKGGLTISAYRITPDGTLAFSDAHPTVNTNGQPIIQILRYRIPPDGNITFLSSMFNLPDYSLISQGSFNCTLGKGISFASTSDR